MFDERAVVYRECDMNYVRPSTYILAYSLVELPMSILCAYNKYIFID